MLRYRLQQQHHRINEFASMVYDPMTERFYTQKLTPFETNMVLEEVRFVPIMKRGWKVSEEINQ